MLCAPMNAWSSVLRVETGHLAVIQARQDLVDAFLHSNWPTIDFVRAVDPTGYLDRVFRRSLRDRDGEAFLTKLQNDVSELPTQERIRMETVIGTALKKLRTKESDSSE